MNNYYLCTNGVKFFSRHHKISYVKPHDYVKLSDVVDVVAEGRVVLMV